MKNRSVVSLVLTVFVVAMGIMSCEDDNESYDTFDVYEQYLKDSLIINAYIEDNELDAYNIAKSGVYISFYHYGDNALFGQPSRDSSTDTTNQYITIGYNGYLTNGSVFDETAVGESTEFMLSRLIAGWQIGIPEMHQGDSATIIIPSYWGYGHYGYGSIPGDAVLIFDLFLESHERR